MRDFLHIGLLMSCLFLAGCRGGLEPVVSADELKGDLYLKIGSSVFETKSADMAVGMAFEDVLVIIADNEGHVVDKVYKHYPYTHSSSSDIQVEVGTGELSEDVIQFSNLKVGAYQVYAYANTGHTDWQVENATIEDVEKALAADGSGILNADRLLKSLGSGEVPSEPGADHGMLLTGHKQLSVGVDANIGEVELTRPVLRFNVYLHNHTPFQLTLEQLSFSHFNASATYLLDHRTSSGEPTVPDGVNYGPLPAYNSANPVKINPPAGDGVNDGRMLVYSTLLYENQAVEDYRMFATVSMKDAQENVHTKELITNGVRLITYDEIAAMDGEAGDSKNVLMVCPTSNGGAFYGVMGASTVSSSAAYSLIESYKGKAEELLKNSSIGSYYQLVLRRTADGKYHVGKTTKNLFKNVSNNGEEGLILEEGFIPTSTEYMVTPDFSGHLTRFRDSKNRFLFGQNNALSVNTSSTSAGNRMWAFYEAYPKGATLKFIDNETAQVKPLTFMTRNQELNVVMNVYFEEVETSFRFEVDNAYWTDERAHKPSHEFK